MNRLHLLPGLIFESSTSEMRMALIDLMLFVRAEERRLPEGMPASVQERARLALDCLFALNGGSAAAIPVLPSAESTDSRLELCA